jgi:hypothetical protein
MYAIVVRVRIAQGQEHSSRAALQTQVIPRIRQAPGFVKGYWTENADQTNGESLMVFGTKQEAEHASGFMRSFQPPRGITLEGVDVREVVAEA